MYQQKTQKLITMLTPLGQVTAYGMEFIDEDGEVCLDPDSETLIRLFQAKEFVEEVRQGKRSSAFSGKQVAYLTALTSVSLLDLERGVGMSKARWSQIKKKGEDAVTHPRSTDLAKFLFNKIVDQIAALRSSTECFVGFEDYPCPPLRLPVVKHKQNGWQPVLQKRALNFSSYETTLGQERKLA